MSVYITDSNGKLVKVAGGGELVAESVALNATRTGQNDTVIEYYMSSDGNTWYRKWASGWKECGGTITESLGGSSTGDKITLPVTFSNTKYAILLTVYTTASTKDTSPNSAVALSITENSFNVSFQYAAASSAGYFSGRMRYYCCGF